MALDAGGELGEVGVADDRAELLLGVEHPGGGPALRHMSPDCQRLTLRLVRRTISIIDSIGFVSEASFRAPTDPEPGERQRLVQALPERAGGAGVGTVELGGERLEPSSASAWSSVATTRRAAGRLTVGRSRSGSSVE